MDAPDSTYESAPDSIEGSSVNTADLSNLPRPPGTQREFSPGALIAERFRIVRLLGRGGMGEVYEAVDLELSESVAIKTLRQEIARDENSMQRFRREIQIARKVTHPNVCRLYDFFQHNAGSSSILCISMELLRGEPLSQRLSRTGPMSVKEAMPIIEQMANGLTAAHRAGVVHRDFKSPNVILTTGRDGLRAVVTDFGLAQAERDDSATALTGPGQFLGTPLYVAPEQIEGGAITPATDVYAFGVVLYEMMTGRFPFQGSSGLETALLRLKTAPQSPRSLMRTIPRHWDAVILKCLSKKSSDRFAFPDQVSEALAGSGRTVVVKRQLNKYRMAVSATLLLLILTAVGLWTYRSFRISSVSGKRRSICVVQPVSMDAGFVDRGTVSQITQLLTNDLEMISSIRVVPHYRVAQAGIDALIGGRNELTPDLLRNIRAQMDSDYVVSGTYTSMRDKSGPVLRVDLKLYDTNTGEMTAAVSASGPENAPLELQNELSNQLRSKLGLRTIQKGDAEQLLVSIPADPAAQKVYSDAVDKLQHYDSAAAVPLLKKVTEITPKFPLAHLDLAEAYANLGYDVLARDEAAQARGMLSGFSEEKKIYVEARSHELAREWKPAIEQYKDLTRSYSDNPEYWLRLALSQSSDGQNDEALHTITTARASLQTKDPRFALAETDIINRSGNFQKVFDASRQAVLAASQAGATSIEAKAWIMQCWAALNLGRPAEARSDCAKGAELSESVHDEATHAKALNVTANALLKEGKTADAEVLYKQVFQILEGIGDEKNLGGAHLNYGNALLNRSDFQGAEREYRLSLAAAEKRQDKADIALATANMAGVLTLEGRLPEAERLYVDALALARSVGAEGTIARCLNNLGFIQASRGELEAAMASYTEALAKKTKLGSEDGRALILVEMGDLLTEQDDLASAMQHYQEALAIQQRLGEKGDAANTQISLARLSLFEDGAPDELPTLRSAIAALDALSDPESAAVGHGVAARLLDRAGNYKEALKEADQASHLLPASAQVSNRMEVELNCARVRAKDVKTSAQTIAALDKLLVQASKQSLLAPQLRARMILAELRGRNSSESRRVLLETVKTEAQAKGFKLIAREAQSAIGSGGVSKS